MEQSDPAFPPIFWCFVPLVSFTGFDVETEKETWASLKSTPSLEML